MGKGDGRGVGKVGMGRVMDGVMEEGMGERVEGMFEGVFWEGRYG